jgi:Tol biopolymer transport system component
MLDRDFALRHLNTVGGFFFCGSAPQLAFIRPDGSEFHILTDGEASNGFPSWSPDEKRIVYRTDAKHGRGCLSKIIGLRRSRAARSTTTSRRGLRAVIAFCL